MMASPASFLFQRFHSGARDRDVEHFLDSFCRLSPLYDMPITHYRWRNVAIGRCREAQIRRQRRDDGRPKSLAVITV